MFTLDDVVTAYTTAPTPILREAVRRWISQIVYNNHHGLAEDDADALGRAEQIFWRSTGEIVERLLHPEMTP